MSVKTKCEVHNWQPDLEQGQARYRCSLCGTSGKKDLDGPSRGEIKVTRKRYPRANRVKRTVSSKPSLDELDGDWVGGRRD